MLRLGERFLGHVGQDHCVVGLKWARSVGKRSPPIPPEPSIRGATSSLTSISFSRRALISSACPVSSLDQEDLGLAPGVREALGDVVDRPLVAAVLVGNELGREGVKLGSVMS